MPDSLQVLRTLDKADRMPPDDVFSLLTSGRRDASGDFTPGCGLNDVDAAYLVWFINIIRAPHIMARFDLIVAFEEKIVDESTGRTAWDALLDAFIEMPEPKSISDVLDGLIRINRC